MAGKVVGWAFEVGQRSKLTPTERFVLIAYADNASEKDGKCWPDKPEIVEKTGLSRATVYRAISSLEKSGHLLFTEDSKGRECIFLSVPWASHGETGTPESDSHDETEASHSETKKSHGENRSNKGTVKNRHKPSCESAAGTFVLPTIIDAPLRQVAEAKDAALDPAAIGRALKAYPDRDHAEEAERFAAWHLHGRGRNAGLSSVAAGFRNWLKRAEPVAAGKQPNLTVVGAEPATARAATKMEVRRLVRARARLRREVPESTYRLWLRPVRLAGISSDAVYLSVSEGTRAWCERRYSSLIAAALAAEGLPGHVSFARPEIVDHREAA